MTAVHAPHLFSEPVPQAARALLVACPAAAALLRPAASETKRLELVGANAALLALLGQSLEGKSGAEAAEAVLAAIDDGREAAFRERVCRVLDGSASPELKVLARSQAFDVLLEARFASIDGLAVVFFSEAQSRDVFALGQKDDPGTLHQAVFEISRAAHEAMSLDSLYETIHGIVERLIGTPNFYIALIDEREHIVRFVYSKDEFDAQRSDRRLGLGATDLVYRTGKPILMDRTLANQMLEAGTLVNYGVPAQVWLGVPLIVTGKTIGVMAVQDYRNAHFLGESERQILTFVSDQIASAIALKQAQEDAKSARSEAEKASQSKGDFLAVMSHELRSPLSVIIGFSDLLQENLVGKPEAKQAASIGEAGQRLLAAVNQILDFSKVDAHSQPVFEEIIELEEVLAVSKSFYLSRIEQKKISYSVLTEGYVPPCVKTDGRIVQQIMTHLLGNAVNFTPEGGRITVGIRADPTPFVQDNEYTVHLSVEDTGCGIAPEKIARLFQPFEQSHRPAPGEGAGLGLATTGRLAELLKGKLAVESTVGQGSIFTFSFTVKAAAKAGTAVAAPSPIEHLERLLRSRLRGDDSPMLVIDAFPDSRAVLAGFVESITGRTTLITPSVREAMEICHERHPYLVLIDAHEPDIDGPALCHEIRSKPEEYGKPFVVILSIDHSPTFVKRCIDAGANDYVPKPISRRSLAQAILAAADSRLHALGGSRPGFKLPERFSATP